MIEYVLPSTMLLLIAGTYKSATKIFKEFFIDDNADLENKSRKSE